MRIAKIFKNVTLIICIIFGLVLLWSQILKHKKSSFSIDLKNEETKKALTVVSVFCGLNKQELKHIIAMLKSLILFQESCLLHIILITDKESLPVMHPILHGMRALVNNSFTFELRSTSFPDNTWRGLFETCASQRLFLPDLLSDYDKIIYADIDVIFLNSISVFWRQLELMNSSYDFSMVMERNESRPVRHIPGARFCNNGGCNSGFLLMNLKNMRENSYKEKIFSYKKRFGHMKGFSDQTVLSDLANDNAEKFYPLSCDYNFRTSFCKPEAECTAVLENGISMLHGFGGTFIRRLHTMKTVFYAFYNYQLGTNIYENLLLPLYRGFNTTPADDECYKYINVKYLRHVFKLKNT